LHFFVISHPNTMLERTKDSGQIMGLG